MIASVAGSISNGKLTRRRPFRARITPPRWRRWSAAASAPSRARHRWRTMACSSSDELPEFSPQVLDSLRQPLESGETVIARANYRVSYPSRMQLVAR